MCHSVLEMLANLISLIVTIHRDLILREWNLSEGDVEHSPIIHR